MKYILLFCVNRLSNQKRMSIGIIICKNKDKTFVEYALKQSIAPICVATYQLSNSLSENMKEMSPEPEEITRTLKIFEKNRNLFKESGAIKNLNVMYIGIYGCTDYKKVYLQPQHQD